MIQCPISLLAGRIITIIIGWSLLWGLVACTNASGPDQMAAIARTDAVAAVAIPATSTATKSVALVTNPARNATATSTPMPAFPAPSMTPFPSSTPTTTATPSITPTPTATSRVFATLDGELPTPATAIPTPVPPFEKPPEVTNVLLLGNDVQYRQGGRTDSIIIVSINRESGTASLLSIPRDLYVYVPGWKMNRMNLVLPHGHGSEYPGGGGQLVKDTILYNMGIEIDYYARIGFEGFKQVIDALGGVEMAVSCQLRDWRLKKPEMNPEVEENWEMYTMEPDVYEMDGDLALWYVRSRRTSNDFERGRRQQQMLRAMLTRGVDLELITRAPELWNAWKETVETDLTLPAMLQLAAIAPEVRQNGIQNLYLSYGPLRAWREPISGAALQLLQWPEAEPVLAALMQPPTLNSAMRAPIRVEVISDGNYIMYQLAADNLAWHGFVPVYGQGDGVMPSSTEISFFGDNFKGSFDWLMAWVMDQDKEDIRLAGAGETSAYDYRVEIGYDYDPCRPELEAPLHP